MLQCYAAIFPGRTVEIVSLKQVYVLINVIHENSDDEMKDGGNSNSYPVSYEIR
ncbi:hypothetical protein Csa_001362 [Cucumis sativus]|uniref:Uncharacterized protein n=1 Tax=Cucumis sativus TaxID=3659 RepID=A0A0A0LII1_CUCSA|nr:hypothetical protein Csa_001362 [Cucumis sativus]